MIVCHPLELIFLKTKKTAGTSFEIALSRFCDDACMITPISPADETIRSHLGFRGPQNYLESERLGVAEPTSPNFRFRGDFENHDTAARLQRTCPPTLFHGYVKVTIHRDPLDFLISQYYFKMRTRTAQNTPTFAKWVQANRTNVLENSVIGPTTGAAACDIVLRYEHLEHDIAECSLLAGQFGETFASLNAKGGFRPQSSRDINAFYEANGVDTAGIYDLLEGETP